MTSLADSAARAIILLVTRVGSCGYKADWEETLCLVLFWSSCPMNPRTVHGGYE